MMKALIVVCALSGMRRNLRKAIPIARHTNSIATLSMRIPQCAHASWRNAPSSPATAAAVMAVTE